MSRPVNPKCGECHHPRTFHSKVRGDGTRPCNAFGCKCEDFDGEVAASGE